MRRPFVPVTFTALRGDAGPVVTVEESLRRFGTIAFGIEYMRTMIVLDRSHVDAGAWFAFVPEVYRAAVEAVVAQVFEEHRGRMIDERGIDPFLEDLNRAILWQIDPVR